MLATLTDYLSSFPVLGDMTHWVALAIAITATLFLAFLANLVVKQIILVIVKRTIKRTKSTHDDTLVKRGVFQRLSHLAPAFVIYTLGPAVLADYPHFADAVSTVSLVYMAVICVFFLDALINAGLAIYSKYSISKTFPITSFAQVAKLIIYFLGTVAVLSILLGESPLTFLAGFGALAAVLMFVFKDPILGFVAGIQLSANKMVSVGDWIEMPQLSVDGDVMEIGLTTVKIRNFDKTITTIPTQALINDSFKNWRGMQETGGRRIKRSINIDISTIKFCDEDMLNRYAKVQYIADYLKQKEAELTAHNTDADPNSIVNGRHLTNVGTFRAYIEAYLAAHPSITDEFTFLIRQLQPTENGLPIELYIFTNTTNWIEYEHIQADIFDHILAAAKEFDLRVFQNPTGSDFAKLTA